MEIREYDRKTFTVNAVEVDFNNITEVAKWCGGELDMEKVRLAGSETKLPCIRMKGQGDKKDHVFVVSLGHFVVELKGSFRVYKPQQFKQAFVEKRKPATRTPLEPGIPTYEIQSDGVIANPVDLPDGEQLESHI